MSSYASFKSARLAVLAAFFFNGLLLATWVSRIPAMQAKLSMSEGTLGLVLMGISAGVIVALSMAGGLVGRFGSRTVTLGGRDQVSASRMPLPGPDAHRSPRSLPPSSSSAFF